jgi:hypothetical protein
VKLVPEYEKKYLMDQAMAGNENYFKGFYSDLENQRFSLIITEPLFINMQDPTFAFQEENNAWVRWVAKPVLCYYKPMMTFREVRIQVLAPGKKSTDCPK